MSMKQCNEVFLDNKGMTSTSANHLANIAAEVVQARKLELENVAFINEYISVLGTNREKVLVEEGSGEEFLDKMKESLGIISDANSFIAWVREAIKAKESELETISNMNLREYCTLVGVDYPEFPSMESPVGEEDILGTWNIKDRNEYYSLEARSAVIGKFIHPNGAFSKARKQLQNKVTKPHSVDKSSSANIVIYDYVPSIEPSKVEDAFFEMQSEHRALSARLNQLKFRIKDEMTKANEKKNNERSLLMEKVSSERAKLMSDLVSYKNTETQRISQLKIVVPESLEGIFHFLQNIQVSKNKGE